MPRGQVTGLECRRKTSEKHLGPFSCQETGTNKMWWRSQDWGGGGPQTTAPHHRSLSPHGDYRPHGDATDPSLRPHKVVLCSTPARASAR